MYGQRYGSMYDPDDAATRWVYDNMEQCRIQHPWITSFQDKSVTEIEYRHGSLNDIAKRPAAFFFRSEAYDRVGI